MRRIIYNIIVIGCVAASFLTACTKECDFPDEQAGSDGNSITLNISSGKLSVSRAVTAEGVEVAVSHLDVLILTIPMRRQRFGASAYRPLIKRDRLRWRRNGSLSMRMKTIGCT